jgi:hypothetical protein
VDVPYYLSKYDPDPLCFYLTATAPETRDTEACPEGTEGSPWEDLVERNNRILSRSPEPCEGADEGNELVATHSLRSVHAWGNARADSGSPEGTRVHAEFRLQAL